MINTVKGYFYRRFRTSFSKSGEDLQLWQLLKKTSGFYLDIGSHHPVLGNNSYFFYLRGWNGICIEPNEIFQKLYAELRSRDVFIQAGVGAQNEIKNYYQLESDQRNTFSTKYIDKFKLHDQVIHQRKIEVFTLEFLLNKYDLLGAEIDFISIDVEGAELDVLHGNDWDLVRPRYILCESHLNLKSDFTSKLYEFLIERDYALIGKHMQGVQVGTLFFKDISK